MVHHCVTAIVALACSTTSLSQSPHETSQGKLTLFPSTYLPHLRYGVSNSYGASTWLAALPPPPIAPDAISVRQARGLPRASFRPHLAVTPLLLAMCFPLSGCTRDFHPLERAHAWRTNKQALPNNGEGLFIRLRKYYAARCSRLAKIVASSSGVSKGFSSLVSTITTSPAHFFCSCWAAGVVGACPEGASKRCV